MKLRILSLCLLLVFSPCWAIPRVNNDQVALSTTAVQIVAASSSRRSILVRNLDASISIYVGGAGVTAATGMLVKFNESIEIFGGGAVYAVAASGTPTVAYLTEND